MKTWGTIAVTVIWRISAIGYSSFVVPLIQLRMERSPPTLFPHSDRLSSLSTAVKGGSKPHCSIAVFAQVNLCLPGDRIAARFNLEVFESGLELLCHLWLNSKIKVALHVKRPLSAKFNARPKPKTPLWCNIPRRHLMTTFYAQRDRTDTDTQALRQAMLITLETHPNPRDWAVFTLIGGNQ